MFQSVPKDVPKLRNVPPSARTLDGTRITKTFSPFYPPTVYTINKVYTRGQFPGEDNNIVEPGLTDCLATLQNQNEQELTYLLILNPYTVLRLAGKYLPELGKREREFWRLVQRNLLPNLEIEKAIKVCYNLAMDNGYETDLIKWEDKYLEHFFTSGDISNSSDRCRELLNEIIAAHDSRVTLEIVQGSTRFQRMGAYYG